MKNKVYFVLFTVWFNSIKKPNCCDLIYFTSEFEKKVGLSITLAEKKIRWLVKIKELSWIYYESFDRSIIKKNFIKNFGIIKSSKSTLGFVNNLRSMEYEIPLQ